jgi:hypothetical protein
MGGNRLLQECQFFLVRYVPNPVRGESLNIGVLLYCREKRYLGCLIKQDLGRIRRFHSQADPRLFQELQHHFEQQIEQRQYDLDAFLQEIQGYSNMIQIAPPQKCMVQDPKAEILKLYEKYVA